MNKTFTVKKCSPSNEGKTFVWTLEIAESVKVFGITKEVKRTYYIGGMPIEVKVGDQFQEDLGKFEIVERPYTLQDSGEVIQLKWLHAKVA